MRVSIQTIVSSSPGQNCSLGQDDLQRQPHLRLGNSSLKQSYITFGDNATLLCTPTISHLLRLPSRPWIGMCVIQFQQEGIGEIIHLLCQFGFGDFTEIINYVLLVFKQKNKKKKICFIAVVDPKLRYCSNENSFFQSCYSLHIINI